MEKKFYNINFRITPAERRLICSSAYKFNGGNVSEFVRQVLLEGIGASPCRCGLAEKIRNMLPLSENLKINEN